jgi:tetratricopeptide (TPR) repeat protein
MEFADTPNFTIAAVTDWTAAGGHGSDAVLRTSEALNRETLALKPSGSGAASASGEPAVSENALKADVARNPGDGEANRRLGEFYLHANRFQDAIPPLRAAAKFEPDRSQNDYDLALALEGSGDLAGAREQVEKLAARNQGADTHRLAGELDEKLGDPLAAVHEFERAVREDPTEQNYFEWGSELLLHRAVWQAKDVFSAGVKAYPKSARMLTALGAALFAGALYGEAAQRLCQASDLDPADLEPYMFMGKIEVAAPNPLACVEQKLARFVELRPNDPLANYFYAMAIWKQKGQGIDPPTLMRVQDLLNTAIKNDPQCSDAYLQLGVIAAALNNFPMAIDFYNQAIKADPLLSQAHYRLGVAYDRVGYKDKAAEQFRLHDEIEKQQAALVDKQRREVKQFLVVVDGKTAN